MVGKLLHHAKGEEKSPAKAKIITVLFGIDRKSVV
jgi:hypothetical protein